jgi:hypothetical protein
VLATKGTASPSTAGFVVVGGGVLAMSFPGVVDVARGVVVEAGCSLLAGSAVGTGGSLPAAELAAVVGVVLPRRERRRTVIVLFITVGFLPWFGLPEHAASRSGLVVMSGVLVVSFPGVVVDVVRGVVAEAGCSLECSTVGSGGSVTGSEVTAIVVGVVLPRTERRRTVIVLFTTVGFLSSFGFPIPDGLVVVEASRLLASAVGTSSAPGSDASTVVMGVLPRREWRRRTIILFITVFGGPLFAESRRMTTVFCWLPASTTPDGSVPTAMPAESETVRKTRGLHLLLVGRLGESINVSTIFGAAAVRLGFEPVVLCWDRVGLSVPFPPPAPPPPAARALPRLCERGRAPLPC